MDFFNSVISERPEKGDLLISEPFLPDPNFERSVIFLCEHDENGSFGFVINQLSALKFGDVIEDAGDFEQDVFVGGPVQQDSLHIMHRSNEFSEGSQEVCRDIYWGADFDKLMFMIDTRQLNAKDFKFFLGYSGWSPGQLEEELEAKSWIVYKNATSEQVFDLKPESLWRVILNEMGGKFKMFSNYPHDPRLN